MNIKNSNKHFEKLSSFYSQVSNDGDVNKIELDLLKSYVLNFYESITSHDAGQASSAPSTAAQVVKPVVEKVAAPIVTPITAPIAAPIVQPAAVEANIPETAVAEQAPSEDVIPKEVPKVEKSDSSELAALFSLETGNEISDKLSMSPIKDLTKAMNINERIFTLKELFSNNKENFDSTMNKLNDLNSYDEATTYLSSEVVEQNGWLDASKTKKVKTFLKLIARKYV